MFWLYFGGSGSCVLIIVVIVLCLGIVLMLVFVLVLIMVIRSNISWCWLVDGVIVGKFVVGEVIK